MGAKGIETYVVEETRFSPAAFSKYCTGSLVCSSASQDPEHFYRYVSDKIKEYGIDVFFPMDEDTVAVAMEHKEELEKICLIPLPEYDSYIITSDKGKAYKHAMSVGVNIPKTVFPEELDDIQKITEHLTYPLMVKPVKSNGGRGIQTAYNKQDILKIYQEVHEQYPYPIIQEHLGEGDVYDVVLLYNSRSELRASFIQKHVRKYPLVTGPSTVQESVIYPEMLEMAIEYMKGLNWFGIADLEFMVQKETGEIKFLELNCKFWNSLQMGINAGVDFPWLLYKIAVDGDVEPVKQYQTGIMCRNLLPGDILHYIFNNDRKNMNPPFWSGKSDGIRDDIISKDDPMPIVGFITACLRYLFDKRMWKFLLRR
ncbi:MAG: hypothetical protein APF84_10625 [Gracilibacter sp. BRH_c7a]|nr:MAG: hypothetical protein APF84_10625 [Gracilibacter sp. BRH_c7a]